MILSCKLGKTSFDFFLLEIALLISEDNIELCRPSVYAIHANNVLLNLTCFYSFCFFFCSCRLGECRIILCEAGAKHRWQKLQLNFPRLVLKTPIIFSADPTETNDGIMGIAVLIWTRFCFLLHANYSCMFSRSPITKEWVSMFLEFRQLKFSSY